MESPAQVSVSITSKVGSMELGGPWELSGGPKWNENHSYLIH